MTTHKCTQEERIKALEKTSTETAADTKDIRDVLLPSEYHPDNGLIKKFERMETRFDNLEKILMQIKNYVLAAIAIFGLIVTLSEIFQFVKEL